MASYAPQNTVGRPGGIRPGFPGKQPRPGIPLPGGKQPPIGGGSIDQDRPGIPPRPVIPRPGGGLDNGRSGNLLRPIGNRPPTGNLRPIDNGRPRSPYDSTMRPARGQAITPQILQQMARRRLGG